MTGTFACPECGGELALLGATPGREIQCARCATWVEVPYLPRDGVWTRPRFRRGRAPWVIPTAWAVVAMFAAVVAVVAWTKAAASRDRAARDATLDAIIASADIAEKSGRPGRALSEVEAALALLRSCAAPDHDRMVELSARRDLLSVREAEARIAAASTSEPDSAVGDLLSLQARARKDRALEPLVTTILGATDAARRRQAAALLDAARSAVGEGRPLDALDAAGRALAVAEKLEGSAGRSVADEAEGLVAPVLARIGVIVAQLPGKFTLGSSGAYDSDLGPIIDSALRRRGFAPRPPAGPSRALWDRHATRRLEFQVTETPGVSYLQSQNRITQVVTRLAIVRGDETLWLTNITARTQIPLPDLPAHASGRIAVADHDPDMAHKLYDNARALTIDRVTAHLRALPEP